MSLSSSEVSMEGIRKNLTSSFDNMCEDKGDTMKVFCRIRPMLPREEEAGYAECIAAVNDEVVRAVVPASSTKFKTVGQEIYEDFKYTIAFGPEVGQFPFFQETILDTITSYVEGQNGLVFSYGITNSGKTYTLQGDDSNPGLITLTCHLFFACIEKQMLEEPSVRPDKFSDLVVMSASEKAKQLQLKEELFRVFDQENSKISETSENKAFGMMLCDAFYDGFKFEERQTTLPPEEMMAAQSALYLKDVVKKTAANQTGFVSIWVSFIEIYNEYIYDLLQPNILQRQKLSLAEDQNGDVYVKGAKEICVSSCEEALKLLELGRRNLRIASTKLNYQSSRSHCIYTLKTVRLFEDADETHGRINRISFCDLAGSERASKSLTSGARLKEAGYINNSLLVLGRCLEQLRLNQTAKDKKMIPYRESKLTRLFYHFFIGKGKATMIANASPCELTFDETLNVLRFSALAKELTLNDTYVSMASNSIQSLTSQWGQLKSRRNSDFSFDTSSDFDTSLSAEIKEKDEIIEKLLDLSDELSANLKKEKQEKAELEIKLRQEIYEDYSQYSDQLLENQKKLSDEYLECVRMNQQKLYDQMVEYYQEKIRLLEEQLDGETSCDESMIEEKRKSILVVDEKIASLEKKQEHGSDNLENFEHQSLVSENDSLKLKISELSNELQQVTAQVKTYSEEIENLKNETKSYEEKKEESVEDKIEAPETPDVEVYKNQISSLTEELQFLKTELEVTKEHLEQKSSQLEKSEADSESSKEYCNSLKLKIDEANQVLDQYKKELEIHKEDQVVRENKLTALAEDKVDLEKEVSALQNKLDAANIELKFQLEESGKAIERRKSLLDDSQEKVKYLQNELEEALKSLEDGKSRCEVLNSEIDSYKKEKEELAEKCSVMENELNRLKTDGESSKEYSNALKLKIDEANQVLDQYKKELETLKDDQILKENKLTALAEDKVNLEKEVSSLQSKLDAANLALKSQLEESSKAADCQKSLIDDSKEKLEGLQNKLEDALKSLEDSKSRCEVLSSEIDGYKKEKAELIEKCSVMENEVEKLKTDLLDKMEPSGADPAEVERQKLAIEELSNKCNLLETAKVELTAKLNESTESIDSQKQAIKELKEKLDALEADKKELVVKLDESEKNTTNHKLTVEELKNKCSSLETELQNSNNVLSDEKVKVEDLLNKNASLETEISKLKENNAQLSVELNNVNNEDKLEASSLTSKIELLEKQSNEYKDENKELINKLQELERQIDTLKETLESEKAGSQSLRDEMKKLVEENTSSLSKTKEAQDLFSKQTEELKKSLQSALDEKEKLNKELNQYQIDLESLLEKQAKASDEVETFKVENSNLKKELKDLKHKLQSSLDHQEEVGDLKRQVKEKEANIEQLEQALKDSQKLRTENEAKHKSQIDSIKNQHAIEIEGLMELKRSGEKELKKLKSAQAEAGKGKDEDEISEPKPKRGKAGRKPKATTSKEESKESDSTSAKGVGRKTKSGASKEETKDSESATAVETKTTRGSRKRKSDQDFEPVKRTNRRKVEDAAENMSPVQKAISYVNTKLRSVAQSLNAPSPRMTRGRRKLFNNESAPAWKL